mmetsp:Transcript_21026/g.25841  ORF Transcript_21026/g.25841 Transcript_21026/m.25841 type:complete len:108 (+) Transcript_21026:1151-1474(+)
MLVTEGPSDGLNTDGQRISIVQQVPRLIRGSIIVFGMFRYGQHPCLHFYNSVKQIEVLKVVGALGLLHDFGEISGDDEKYSIMRVSCSLGENIIKDSEHLNSFGQGF